MYCPLRVALYTINTTVRTRSVSRNYTSMCVKQSYFSTNIRSNRRWTTLHTRTRTLRPTVDGITKIYLGNV